MPDRFILTTSPVIKVLIRRVQAARRSQFAALPRATNKLVFLGDSITEQGMWDEWLPELHPVNRGLGGDTISGVLGRLDTALDSPRAVALLIGTNDISGFGRSRKIPEIAEQMRELVQRIRDRAPDAPLFVNSVMPRGSWLAPRIRDLNDLYRAIATESEARYVDLWPALADPDHALRKEFTEDQLHLTGPGYQAWVDVLRPHLSALATGPV